jgi:hypothetical protein
MSSSTTTPAHASKTTFMHSGIELTILETPTTPLDDCAICTRPIYSGSHSPSPAEPGLRITSCGHVLGATCALKWFEEHNSCPFCRKQLFPMVKPLTWMEAQLRRLDEVYESPAVRAAEAFYEARELADTEEIEYRMG